eukprot:1158527-Pelagomonas_calceolata.AAC.13
MRTSPSCHPALHHMQLSQLSWPRIQHRGDSLMETAKDTSRHCQTARPAHCVAPPSLAHLRAVLKQRTTLVVNMVSKAVRCAETVCIGSC